MNDVTDHLAAGQAALKSASWPAAKLQFETALIEADTPEAHDGLGLALWWLNDIHASHAQRAAAYVGYKKQRAVRRAARMAMWLAREQVFLSANYSAMKGWFARAERLLLEVEPCVEHGWFALFRASLLATPQELEQVSEQALRTAQQFEDPDLEAMALAFAGAARVACGRVGDGLANLDEAMAAATSGELDYASVSEIFCVMLSTCDLTGDLVRTGQWCQTAAEFAAQHHCPFLAATCRTIYGSLLTATGRWHDAEIELSDAIRSFEAGHRALRAQAVIKLADLRVLQGKLEEAEVLLSGFEDHSAASLTLARLYLARGETARARAVIEPVLPSPSTPGLDQVPALRLWVDVQLALGDLDGARQAVERLESLAHSAQSDLLLAQADLARGQVKRHAGDADALRDFQSALDRLRAYEQSLLASRTRLEMARLLSDSDRPAAVMWARAALASFERMGAAHDADETASLLRHLGVTAHSGPRLQAPLTQREAEVLALVAQGRSNREIAERLVISPKTAEHHVSQILSKIGARSRAEAAAFAMSNTIGGVSQPRDRGDE
jgi:ATP/maltotriose-dependent transcriptional regulator MalT